MKPREFWIRTNDSDETDLKVFKHDPLHIQSSLIFGRIHVREVVPIDWKLIFVDYCLQTQKMDDFELIKELVEKQLAGDTGNEPAEAGVK